MRTPDQAYRTASAALAQILAGRRVVVTGGAGFIGSHLCQRLLEVGAQVVAVDDLSTGRLGNLFAVTDHPCFTFLGQDVCLPLGVSGPVDAVFHLASPASPRDYGRLPIPTLMTGAVGTQHALELARSRNALFVLASTSEVYGDPTQHPQREGYWGNVNPVGPRSVYDEAKRFAEALTTAYQTEHGVDATIVRIFNTYGPRMRVDDGRAVPTFLHQARSGRSLTVTGDGSQTRSLCYVSDTVEGLLAACGRGDGAPINLGNPHESTMIELAERIQSLCGSTAPIEFIDRPTDDPKRRCPDITRARHLLGWEPHVDLDTGLALTLDELGHPRPELTGTGGDGQ
ncbi:NAD-dependent epimerase/dehydratase family protein [Nocardiopsis tropica]|uniref:GDP-mannose 4,6-dehydratase n=1 Tax=Nocardiopsis tropica TaxID=109330 RepID=A0ABU7KNQ4_9ACTN|nr:NAD-dependent epimerase/dehydratase family protein [Nocardiopsis umidischolae]MEE2050654.1 GDP-mannose 4,6-dehydratase [Nocardiopsis umidischolae]